MKNHDEELAELSVKRQEAINKRVEELLQEIIIASEIFMLTDFPILLTYCEQSPTFKSLYEGAVANNTMLVDCNIYTADSGGIPGAIHLPDVYLYKEQISPDDIAVLAHELRHAVQDCNILDPVEGEKEAYRFQAVVREELVASGCQITEDSFPLTEEEIEEFYVPFYAEQE